MTLSRSAVLASLLTTAALVTITACVGDDPTLTTVDEDAGGQPPANEAGPGSGEGGGGDGGIDGALGPPTGAFAWEMHGPGPATINDSIELGVGGTAPAPILAGVFSNPNAGTMIEGKPVPSTGLATFRAAADKTVSWVSSLAALTSVGAVAVDSVGDIYVGGSYLNTTAVTLSATATLPANPSSGSADFYLKMSGVDGKVLWARSIATSSTGQSYVRSIATRGTDVVVGGNLKGQATYVLKTTGSGPVNTTIQSEGDLDGYVLSLDGSDGTVKWAKRIGGPGSEQVISVAFDDSDGSVLAGGYSGPLNQTTVALDVDGVATGISSGPFTFAGLALRFAPTGSHDLTLSKAFQGDNAIVAVKAIAAAPNHGVTVCGTVSAAPIQVATATLTSNGGDDVFVANVLSGGTATYGRALGGSANEECTGIAVDAVGNAAVTVTSRSANVTLDNHTFVNADVNHPQATVFKLDPKGDLAWAFDIGGSSSIIGSIALVPGTGDVVYSGLVTGSANLGAGDIQSPMSGTAPFFFAVRRGY